MRPIGNHLRRIARFLTRLPSAALILLIRGYQRVVSPLLGPRCRYVPTCSEYFILAVKKYGLFGGTLRGIWRICRCHPWSKGGYDPP